MNRRIVYYSAEPWIAHTGEGRPPELSPSDDVEVRYRDGDDGQDLVRRIDWEWKGRKADIVAYRRRVD